MDINPFIVSGKIAPEYFCDRVDESTRLTKLLRNGNNVVLISPRRMGKTGLVYHCYDSPEIAEGHYTFFIDILHTGNLNEFTHILGREIYDTLRTKGQKMASDFIRGLSSLEGKFGFDLTTGLPTFTIGLGDIREPEYIFSFLETADKPCIITINEFQQIGKYPEKNVEALLRTYIQKMGNAKFVFAGSEENLMQRMFSRPSAPFYKSAETLWLAAIPQDAYAAFATGNFEKRGRHIEGPAFTFAYDKYRGHTYYVQKLLNEAFARTEKGGTCTVGTMQEAEDEVIEASSVTYGEVLSRIPDAQRGLLYAIAAHGESEKITSGAFIRDNGLSSASSVQSAARQLLLSEHISLHNGKYSVTDKFFGEWLRRLFA